MIFKDLIFVLGAVIAIGLLFVGWVALLHFPWEYSVRAALIFEAILITLLILSENDAASVNGAGGWMTFGFMIGHVILFLSAGFLRILVFLWGLF